MLEEYIIQFSFFYYFSFIKTTAGKEMRRGFAFSFALAAAAAMRKFPRWEIVQKCDRDYIDFAAVFFILYAILANIEILERSLRA
jgi:hypothetical protein